VTNHQRRRILQAGLAAGSLPLLRWGSTRAQAPERNLLAAPRRALVIGNAAYPSMPLKNPVNDARGMAEELRSAGFEVATGIDLGRAAMLEAIRAYAQSLSRSGPVGLFYFAGHGVQLGWRNYLLPTDARVERPDDIQRNCIDLNAVIEGMGKAGNPMNVIILDACRDNPFGGALQMTQKGLSQLDAPPGTLLAYATSPGNTANDGEGANGLYTEQLLREIKVPDAKIEDVFKRVRLAVRRRSNGQQIPWESTSLEEDFWFIPPRELKRLAEEEAERTRQVQEAERARQDDLQRQRSEQLERARQVQLDRSYQEELELWQRDSGAKEPGPLEDYLRRYPSGRFAELAQLQLDAVLARQGEKPIQIAPSEGNPYTQGSARADIGYKVGDSYTYVQFDRDTKQEQRRFTSVVTQVTEGEVNFGKGALVLDRLGNTIKLPDGRRFTPRQDQPLEYAIGKKWSTRYSVVNQKGRSAESEFEFRIVRRERITVPAGSFDCWVIEGEGYATNDRGLRIQFSLKRWMAPEKVRRPIVTENYRKIEGLTGERRRNEFKLQAQVGRVLNNERLELVAYRQS
jgi:hypothetical protein